MTCQVRHIQETFDREDPASLTGGLQIGTGYKWQRFLSPVRDMGTSGNGKLAQTYMEVPRRTRDEYQRQPRHDTPSGTR